MKSMNQYPQADATETERNAYNLAFCELGLEWYWDAPTFATLQAREAQKSRVHAYVESHQPHLLRAYDPSFLEAAVESVRNRFVRAQPA